MTQLNQMSQTLGSASEGVTALQLNGATKADVATLKIWVLGGAVTALLSVLGVGVMMIAKLAEMVAALQAAAP